MKSENRQAHTLFGVVALFLIGHLFRMILNLHEVFIDSSSDTYSQTNDSCLIDHEVRTSDTTRGKLLVLWQNFQDSLNDYKNIISSDYLDTIDETESVLPTNSSISCINPNRDCIYSLTLWILVSILLWCFILHRIHITWTIGNMFFCVRIFPYKRKKVIELQFKAIFAASFILWSYW